MSGHLDKRLSDHFLLYEMVRSQTADRNGIVNMPDVSQIAAGMALGSNVLDPIREEFGSYSPQSWFRGEDLERVVAKDGFVRWANNRQKSIHDETTWQEYFILKSHPRGEAADIEVPKVSNDLLFKWIQENLTFDEVIREYAKPGEPNSGWVHVSYSLSHNRNRVRHIG